MQSAAFQAPRAKKASSPPVPIAIWLVAARPIVPLCVEFSEYAEITAAALVVEGSLLTPVLSSSLTRERPRIAEDD